MRLTRLIVTACLFCVQLTLVTEGMSNSAVYAVSDILFWLAILYPVYDWKRLRLKGKVVMLEAIADSASVIATLYLPALDSAFDAIQLAAVLAILWAFLFVGGGMNDDDDDDSNGGLSEKVEDREIEGRYVKRLFPQRA